MPTLEVSIYPALVLALNGGMRDSEIRRLTWSQIDWEKKVLTVGRSKTDAGTGRTIPVNGTLLEALLEHTRWYTKHFGGVKPEWFVFPGGSRFPKDPTRRSDRSKPPGSTSARRQVFRAAGTITDIR